MSRSEQPPQIPDAEASETLYNATRKEGVFYLQRRNIGRVILATDDGAVYGFYTSGEQVGVFSIGGSSTLGRHRGAPEQYTLPTGEQGSVLTPVGSDAEVTGYQLFHRECSANDVSVTKADGDQIGKLISYVFANDVGIALEEVGATLYEPMQLVETQQLPQQPLPVGELAPAV